MLSVVIATKDSERALVPTLAALVPGATAGLVSEVLIADGGSRDDTTAVAEHAGCNFVVMDAPLAQRLNAAAGKARAQWLLFLQPGMVLDSTWIGDAQRFAEHVDTGGLRRSVSAWRADAGGIARRSFPARDRRSAACLAPSKDC